MPLNGFVTNVLKLSVGRPRPFFVNQCWPDDGDIPDDAFQAAGKTIAACSNPDIHKV